MEPGEVGETSIQRHPDDRVTGQGQSMRGPRKSAKQQEFRGSAAEQRADGAIDVRHAKATAASQRRGIKWLILKNAAAARLRRAALPDA